MSWSCLHVFYAEPQDTLLSDAIAPLVARLRQDGLGRWFFLRYWLGGPHVRLRVAFDEARGDEQLEVLRAGLSDYVRLNPSAALDTSSERAERAYAILAALEGVSQATATSSIAQSCVEKATYEPEYAKYGGAAGVAIAEELFERSSDIALAVIAATHGSRTARLGQALNMMLVGTAAAGHDERACGELLARLAGFWSRYVSDAQRERWGAELATNLPALARRVEGLFSRPSDGLVAAGPLAQAWAGALRVAFSRVDEAAAEVLERIGSAGGLHEHVGARDFLLINYLHTHNNRLGIIPAHEAYLAFLGHHAVSLCLGIPPAPPPGSAGESAYARSPSEATLVQSTHRTRG